MRLLATLVAVTALFVGLAACDKHKSKSSDAAPPSADKIQADLQIEKEHLEFATHLHPPTDAEKALAKKVAAAMVEVPHFNTERRSGLDRVYGSKLNEFFSDIDKNCPLFSEEKREGLPGSPNTVKNTYETHATEDCLVRVQISKTRRVIYTTLTTNGVQDADLDTFRTENYSAKTDNPSLQRTSGWSELTLRVSAESRIKRRGNASTMIATTSLDGTVVSPTVGLIKYGVMIKDKGGDKQWIHALFDVDGTLFILSAAYKGSLLGATVYLDSEPQPEETALKPLLERFIREFRI